MGGEDIYLSGGTRAIFTVYVQFLVSSGVANPVAEGIEREREIEEKRKVRGGKKVERENSLPTTMNYHAYL